MLGFRRLSEFFFVFSISFCLVIKPIATVVLWVVLAFGIFGAKMKPEKRLTFFFLFPVHQCGCIEALTYLHSPFVCRRKHIMGCSDILLIIVQIIAILADCFGFAAVVWILTGGQVWNVWILSIYVLFFCLFQILIEIIMFERIGHILGILTRFW
jgi:hypothetical protein